MSILDVHIIGIFFFGDHNVVLSDHYHLNTQDGNKLQD